MTKSTKAVFFSDEPVPEERERGPSVVAIVCRGVSRFAKWVVVLGTLVIFSAAFVAGRQIRIQTLEKACQTGVDAGDWATVRQAATQLRFWQPSKASPVIFLAEAANQQGRLEQAVSLLRQLPDDDPMTPPALLECSHLLFGPLNRPLDAAEVLERALRCDPSMREARRRLIYFYAFTLQRRKMVEHAYAAIEHGSDMPETYVYLFSQDYLSFANAYDENSRWLEGNPDEEIFLVARAIYRIVSMALDETEDTSKVPVDEATGIPMHKRQVADYFKRFPNNIELLAYFLREASTNGDAAEVARLLSTAPSAAADDNRFWRYMGWLHRNNEEWLDAERCYQKALQINPYDYVTQHQLAAVGRRLNRPEYVETLEPLAREGQNLRRELLQLPNVTSVPLPLLNRMAIHAAACGDKVVAGRLYERTKKK
ncbi:MAG TPA: tetratricopeptide repeat protein [Pirellulaceae bacterium]|nr:tetratricopeptide repeat protein [Pirellulaceae bacterium]